MAANQLRAPSLMLGYWAHCTANPVTFALTATGSWLGMGFVTEQAKTLSAARLYLSALAGTPAASELTCDLYSDNAGVPLASLEPRPADSVPAALNWVQWSGFTTALAAGTQYWLVWKNTNATPGTNAPTYQMVGPQAVPLGAGGNFAGAAAGYGWLKATTVNGGTSWATGNAAFAGVRLAYSDGTFDGLPVQNCVRPTNGGAGDRATGKQEAGVRFNVPSGATLNARGAWMPLAKVSTPGNLRFRLYQGATLLATSNDVPAANVTTAQGEGYTAFFPAAVALSSANNPYRLVMSDATAADGSTKGYNGELYTWDGSAAGLALKPMDGSLQKTVTADNTASPVVFTDTAADLMAFALLLDTAGELTSSGGGAVGLPLSRLVGGL